MMEWWFKVEAKIFFSTKAAKLCLEERRKGFLGIIRVGHQCASWLAATVEEASLSPMMEDFVKSYSEGRMLSVRGGCNKAGRFLEVAASLWMMIRRVSSGSLRPDLGGLGEGLW